MPSADGIRDVQRATEVDQPRAMRAESSIGVARGRGPGHDGCRAGRESVAPPRRRSGRRRRPGHSGGQHLSGREPSDRTTNRCPHVLRVPGRRGGSHPRLRLAAGLAPLDPEWARRHDHPAVPRHDELDHARHPSPTPRRGEGRVGHLGRGDAGPHHGTCDHARAHHDTADRDTAHGGAPDRGSLHRDAANHCTGWRSTADRGAPDYGAPDYGAPHDGHADHPASDDRSDDDEEGEADPARPIQEVSALVPGTRELNSKGSAGVSRASRDAAAG
jgi:hypothetical protein